MSSRCQWAGTEPLMVAYHDREWGVPVHDDRKLFEFLILEGAQAGLSWATILKRRSQYKKAFSGYDVERIARYSDLRIEKLLGNPGIIRNRLKVTAAITNARLVLEVQDGHGSFDAYIWQFTEGRSVQNYWKSLREVPSRSPASDAMSRDLRQRGFKFVGSTICYAFMQAVGMINDHTVDCFRHDQVARIGGTPPK